jgi:hypothetical protein
MLEELERNIGETARNIFFKFKGFRIIVSSFLFNMQLRVDNLAPLHRKSSPHGSSDIHVEVVSSLLIQLFVTVPDSRINSWELWFIFNLRKINTNQYYELDSLNARNSNTIHEYMTLQDDKCI